ncbi:hypothetical protein [Paenibacillus tarimensis]|uniref:hypothetical protein n=1 Tax=Paenibacillus tarimensis TaxID=416012 RepID=UPI001F3433F4|nr:hypothetical protein [Paenibacillus tarimensis]MCF2945613.1 hypothetical protein [Paenibacillus tarimensis]
MRNNTITFNSREYTILYQHDAAGFCWTKAYRMDENHHIELLQLTENREDGRVHAETIYVHHTDIKRIMLDILLAET